MVKESASKTGVEELLIENFVELQRAITNLSSKFEGLSNQISRLLGVFELAAKNVVESSPNEYSKEIVDRLNNLVEQNSTIASGLVALEERTRRIAPPIGQQPMMNRPVQTLSRPNMSGNVPTRPAGVNPQVAGRPFIPRPQSMPSSGQNISNEDEGKKRLLPKF